MHDMKLDKQLFCCLKFQSYFLMPLRFLHIAKRLIGGENILLPDRVFVRKAFAKLSRN